LKAGEARYRQAFLICAKSRRVFIGRRVAMQSARQASLVYRVLSLSETSLNAGESLAIQPSGILLRRGWTIIKSKLSHRNDDTPSSKPRDIYPETSAAIFATTAASRPF
jgi:hypothetical protein